MLFKNSLNPRFLWEKYYKKNEARIFPQIRKRLRTEKTGWLRACVPSLLKEFNDNRTSRKARLKHRYGEYVNRVENPCV